MTYDSFEKTPESSKPAELYRFVLGTDSFEYTSGEDLVTAGGFDYDPIAIKRNKLGQGSEQRGNNLEITVPSSNAFANLYLGSVPGATATLTIRRVQRDDFPGPEIITIFEGRVQSVAYTDNGKLAKIAVAPALSATSRIVPKFTFQGLCNNVLYDASCKVDETNSTWRLPNALVISQTGNDLVVTGAGTFTDGWFVAGFVEALAGTDARLVLGHVGTTLTLLLPFPQDLTGDVVTVLAGCDHTITVCDTKFFTPEDPDSNVLNFGGFAFVPTRNPFTAGLQ